MDIRWKCASQKGNVPGRREMCLAEGKCAWQKGNVSRRREMCLAEGKCVSQKKNVNRRREMCLAEGKCVSQKGNVSRRISDNNGGDGCCQCAFRERCVSRPRFLIFDKLWERIVFY